MKKDTVYNLTDAQNLKFVRLNADKDRRSYDYLLSDPRGRWFLMQLGSWNFVNNVLFTGTSETFFNEGRRAVALKIYDEIRSVSRGARESLLLAQAEWQRERENLAEQAKGDNNG